MQKTKILQDTKLKVFCGMTKKKGPINNLLHLVAFIFLNNSSLNVCKIIGKMCDMLNIVYRENFDVEIKRILYILVNIDSEKLNQIGACRKIF